MRSPTPIVRATRPKRASASAAALGLSPDDAPAHELLAEALIKRGRRAEAPAEWRRVLQLDHGVIAREARRLLAKYP